MKGYLYETHMHTYPVSKCATASIGEALSHYKALGYQGVFITNHFLDGNINCDRSLPYKERVEFYFSDYEKALVLGKEIGIDVFLGVESSYGGTDFLIYGLDKAWFLSHPEIEGMKRSELLSFLGEAGAFIVQAHPFRLTREIDHVRLFPRRIHGVEIFNAHQNDIDNTLARNYALGYDLVWCAGSDNHIATERLLGGMRAENPILDERDFIERARRGDLTPFKLDPQTMEITYFKKDK